MAGPLRRSILLTLVLCSLLLAGCASEPGNVPVAGPGDLRITAEPENQTVGEWADAAFILYYHNEAGTDLSMCGPALHQLRIDVEGPDDTRWNGTPRADNGGPCPTTSVIVPGIPQSIAVPFHRFQFSDGSLPGPEEPGTYLVVIGHPHYAATTGAKTVRLASGGG